MVAGIGMDIIETERVQKAMNEAFLARVFTENERALFVQRKMNVQVVAGNWAAKEAVAKALGIGLGEMGFHNAEILRNENGQPYVRLYETALALCNSMGTGRIFVTITNLESLAAATAVWDVEQEG